MNVFPLSVEAGELRITVDGIRSVHGTVVIGLYDSPASFGKAVEASAKEGFLIDPDRFAAVAPQANAALTPATYSIVGRAMSTSTSSFCGLVPWSVWRA